MIWCVVFVATLLTLIWCGYDNADYNYKRRRNLNKEENTEYYQVPQQTNSQVLTIKDYDNIFAMVKTMLIDIAEMQEIRILIDKNAEVESSVLDYDNDYVSDKFLVVRYEKLKAKLELDWTFFGDVYEVYEKLIPTRSRPVIDKYRDYIKAFVEGRVNDI